MVARTPTKEMKLAAVLNPVTLRETIKKVDKCMARLQEIQFTVSGGKKVVPSVRLSPRSTRGYLRTSIRCREESESLKKAASDISPSRQMQDKARGQWRRMSLPAMLVGETLAEISQFTRHMMPASRKYENSAVKNHETPVRNAGIFNDSKRKPSHLLAKRKTEKQRSRTEQSSPKLLRVRSRITFRTPPPRRRRPEWEAPHVAAHKVTPRNRPWARKKTVLFPNPLFLSSPSSKQQKFCKTRSPVLGKTRPGLPQRFVKSPAKISARINSSTPRGSLRRIKAISVLKRNSISPSSIGNRMATPLKNFVSPLRRTLSMPRG